jgi:hypothetical protein
MIHPCQIKEEWGKAREGRGGEGRGGGRSQTWVKWRGSLSWKVRLGLASVLVALPTVLVQASTHQDAIKHESEQGTSQAQARHMLRGEYGGNLLAPSLPNVKSFNAGGGARVRQPMVPIGKHSARRVWTPSSVAKRGRGEKHLWVESIHAVFEARADLPPSPSTPSSSESGQVFPSKSWLPSHTPNAMKHWRSACFSMHIST